MTRRLSLLAVALVVLGLSASVAARSAPRSAAATPKVNAWVVSGSGFTIYLPTSWNVIPRTKSGLRTAITTLTRDKQTSLASAYRSVLDSPVALSELSIYKFQAFVWPPLDSLVPTEVDVEVLAGTTKYSASDLLDYASEFGHALGVAATTPTRLHLDAGSAAFFSAVTGSGKTKMGLQYYLFVHDQKLYILSFQIGDSFLAKNAAALRAIAKVFSFKTAQAPSGLAA